MADLDFEVENFFQSAPLLCFKDLLHRHVNALGWQAGVHHDDGENANGCGVDFWYAAVHRGGLCPHGHGIAGSVVFRSDKRILNHGRGDRQRDVDRFTGLERARGGGGERKIPVDGVGRDAGVEGKGGGCVAVVLHLHLNGRGVARRQ